MCMSENESVATSIEPQPAGDIVARRYWGFVWKPVVVGTALFAMGLWFLYDGWVKYPADNQRIFEVRQKITDLEKNRQEKSDEYAKLKEELPTLKEHTGSDINLQRVLGALLTPFGLYWLFSNLGASRGEVRLSGNTLNVPGHPPVTLDQFTELDSKRWERKGIAIATYQLPDGQSGSIRLDDFLYQRKPIDQIYDKIAAKFPDVDEPGESEQPAQSDAGPGSSDSAA